MTSQDKAAGLWGCGNAESVFGGHPRVIVPWPRAPRSKRRPALDPGALAELESNPPDLIEVDPRTLWANQPWVLRQHVDYYLTGRWERTGLTSADQHLELNRFPVVIADQQDRLVIASGHHRSTAALIEGRPLLVRRVATSRRCAVTPLLWWDPKAPAIDQREATEQVASGCCCSVPTLDLARSVLAELDVPSERAGHWIATIEHQTDRAVPVGQTVATPEGMHP